MSSPIAIQTVPVVPTWTSGSVYVLPRPPDKAKMAYVGVAISIIFIFSVVVINGANRIRGSDTNQLGSNAVKVLKATYLSSIVITCLMLSAIVGIMMYGIPIDIDKIVLFLSLVVLGLSSAASNMTVRGIDGRIDDSTKKVAKDVSVIAWGMLSTTITTALVYMGLRYAAKRR